MTALAVAIDARRTQDRPIGGVGRALLGLLPELARRCDLTVLTDARRESAAFEVAVDVVPLAAPIGLPEVAWMHGPARRWRRRHPHVFHGTFNALPTGGGGGPSVVTIHDLSFEVHPEDFGAAKRRVFQVQARAAARSADHIVTVSRFSADELIEHYRVAPERITVITHAVDPGFGPERADASHGGRPYVVALGGARRRGLEVAVQAWRLVREGGVDVELCTVGGPDLPPEAGLRQLHHLDDAAWASLLAGAEAFVYPTRYEGFGLPALEAAASGTPVVCARVASLPEVLGEAAAWCEQPTSAQIAEQLRAVLTDGALAEHLAAAGLEQARRAPTWADLADAHLTVYRRVVDA
ncbi:MAG: glycosyltransferase family 4 protein [Actinomycetota bacterium]|nr:glycosyltransferase family 4 protein [Actinomycetota bacterium]